MLMEEAFDAREKHSTNLWLVVIKESEELWTTYKVYE